MGLRQHCRREGGKIKPQIDRTRKPVFAYVQSNIVGDAFRPETKPGRASRAVRGQVMDILMQQRGPRCFPSSEDLDVIAQFAVKRVSLFGGFRFVAEVCINSDRLNLIGNKSRERRTGVGKVRLRVIQDREQPFIVRLPAQAAGQTELTGGQWKNGRF